MTDFEIFKAYIEKQFGFTHCDVGESHDGAPWVSFANWENYTFFYFDADDGGFGGCTSRRYSDHAKIETPARMLRLRDDFKEVLQK